jgi:hypothetical protein
MQPVFYFTLFVLHVDVNPFSTTRGAEINSMDN